jgi:4-hydroxy-tetrahydrodipicolinate synthase
MREGFYTALGTPLDDNGDLVASSLQLHVEDQVMAEASGLLVMGSMGQQASVKNSEFVKVARLGTEAARGACPVFVGVMDNSISRVIDRIRSLEGLKLDGVVATMPFYYKLNQAEAKQFFTAIAAVSPFPVYLYDLPSVTQAKIEITTVLDLMYVNNIAGIKTNDLNTSRVLQKAHLDASSAAASDFQLMFSGLDVFDIVYDYGITKQLDGMFACTAPIAKKLYEALSTRDLKTSAQCLNDILLLRDVFVSVGVFTGFTCAMNLLGFSGNFAPDYLGKLDESAKEQVKACMQRIGLLD